MERGGAARQQQQNWQAVKGWGNEHLNQPVSKVKMKWIRSGCRLLGVHMGCTMGVKCEISFEGEINAGCLC